MEIYLKVMLCIWVTMAVFRLSIDFFGLLNLDIKPIVS